MADIFSRRRDIFLSHFGAQSAPVILIVEDNKINQLLVCNMLRNFGFTKFDCAENGKTALEKFRQNKYDLILLDIELPDMNGYDISLEIRTNMPASVHQVPIIALSANVSDEDKERAFHAGINDYIVKPYTEEDLFASIIQANGQAKNNALPMATDHLADIFSKNSFIYKYSDSFSLSTLNKYTGGDQELAARLIEIMLRQLPETIEKLETLIPGNDWKNVHAAVHKLKGSIAVFEFMEMKRILVLMEVYADNRKNLIEMPVLFNKFKMLSSAAVADLETILSKLKKVNSF